jgi:serine/threonine protein phosphatase PrpC
VLIARSRTTHLIVFHSLVQVVDYITEVVFADENTGAEKEKGAAAGAKQSNGKKDEKNEAKKGGKNGAKAAAAIDRVSAQEAAESLIDLALAEGSMDNITAVVVKYL